MAQTQLAEEEDSSVLFDGLLRELLVLTESEYGFIGEVMQPETNSPYLKAHAITNIAWDDETRRFYEENAPKGLEFHNLQTLFGAVIRTGKPVIANDPSTDVRSGGLPKGHPPLRSFLGIPFLSKEQMIGMVGVANRPGGYDERLIDLLQPFLQTCANTLLHLRVEETRRKTEIALRQNEAFLRSILNSALDAIITIDQHGVINDVNPATEHIFGYDRDELIGCNISLLMPEPHRSRHDEYIREYRQTGHAKVIGIGREVEGLHKDGTCFPIDLAVTELRHGEGVLFTGIVRDISERKQAQKTIESSLQQLTRSHHDLLSIFNLLRIGTIVLAKEGRITFASERFHCIEELECERIVGRHWNEIFPIDKDSADSLQALLDKQNDTAARLPLRWKTPNGKAYDLELEIKTDPRDESQRILFLYDVTELHRLKTELEHSHYGHLVGSSKSMRRVFELIESTAVGDWTVLIQGETGVGKELVARAIHSASKRKDGPFIAVNCAAISESLLISQLFGHRRGAFTGALTDQPGVFEAATRGTIFLDEIGDISPSMQSALLRVFQEREIIRVGETLPRKVDIRILAATNRDLEEEVRSGRFRDDLLYRIRVARIRVPPLRERIEDIPLLVSSFLAEQRVATGKAAAEFDIESMERILRYDWPGNVRELKSAVEYAVMHSHGAIVVSRDLPPELHQSREGPDRLLRAGSSVGEREQILNALKRTKGNRSEAAKFLGISRATFYRRLKQLRIEELK